MATDWTADLKTLDLDGIAPMFDPLADHPVDAKRELPRDFALRRTPTKRTMLDLRRVSNAVAHLGRLPARGETIHLVCKGEYALFHHIPAILRLSEPAAIRYLAVLTLGFSKQNIEHLVNLLDAGQVGRLDFIFSAYFRGVEHEACDMLVAELERREQRVVALRTHAKIILAETTTDDSYVIESSANLRSCRNVEQSTFTNDASLLAFHRRWIDSLFKEPQK